MGGRGLDDAAPFAVLHPGEGETRRVEGGVEVERDDEVPFVERKFLDRRDMLHAGIVDEDIHPAERIGGVLHHRFDLVDLGQVMAGIERLRAGERFEALPFLFDRVLIAEAVDDDVRAFARQSLGIGEANARSGAGDQGGLASQGRAHAFFSLR